MEHEFWQARWQGRQIGFHEGAPNAFLVAHHAHLASCKRILVPLCGKTEDMAFLAAQGHDVVGIELVETAVREFFAEHAATPEVREVGAHKVFTAGRITIIAGDFFTVTPALTGDIDGIYDRAALIALPPAMRTRYIAHLRLALAPRATRELLVTLDYPPGVGDGPPFAVPESEVREHFAAAHVTHVAERPDGRIERFGGKAVEHCYTIELATRPV